MKGNTIMARDPFALETRGIDDVDVTVLDARFEDQARQEAISHYLVLTLDVNDPDYAEPEELALKVGDDWSSADGSETQLENRPEKNFFDTSAAGVFVASLVENGAHDEMLSRFEKNGFTMRHAGLYKGLKFHLGREDHNYGPEIGNVARVICETFQGVAGTSDAAKAKASTGAAKATGGAKKALGKSTAATEPAAADPSDLLDPELKEALIGIVKGGLPDGGGAFPDHDAFMEEALTYDLPEDDNVLDAIKSTGPGSVWALGNA